MKLAKILVTGRVQGVYYRGNAKIQAEQLGLAGFARNEPDGSVYIEVEGPENSLDEFVEWCQIGPQQATVATVTCTIHEPVAHHGFKTF